jgi:hypothetical protein
VQREHRETPRPPILLATQHDVRVRLLQLLNEVVIRLHLVSYVNVALGIQPDQVDVEGRDVDGGLLGEMIGGGDRVGELGPGGESRWGARL